MKEKYSLWFMPGGSVYNNFETIIKDLAKKYNAPTFKPHITLIGSITDTDIFEKTELLSKKIKPFTIKIVKASYMFDYFRCVLALAEESPEIMGAANFAIEIFTDYNKRDYIPHLSLMYGDFSEQIKQKIVKELGNINMELEVKDIKVVTSGNVPENWAVEKEYKLG